MPPNDQTPPPIPPPYRPGQMGGTPVQPPAQPPPQQVENSGPPRQQAIERIKQANNVLVTVSNNPSVDQLAACIGLTLALNKLGKHATAVFSGAVPSTIEFLQPEKTIEKNTDSLRDFIIALDKSKADKLRYKVEDKFVKIFITPYKTSLSEKDLEFSQGDFNVEVVIALGVHQKEELDLAITAHGRILHDATVISINNHNVSQIGAINWAETSSSSLSELLVGLVESLQPGVLDPQMSTAFLTGIVAETERFSNTKTSAVTMGIASQLMRAGANQQLIATKLDEPPPVEVKPPIAEQKADKKNDENDAAKPPETPKPPEPKNNDGSLQIPHDDHPEPVPPPPAPPASEEGDEVVSKIRIDEQGELHAAENSAAEVHDNSKIMLNPPSMGGTLTANVQPESEEPSADPLSQASNNSPLLSRTPSAPATMPTSDFGSNTTNAYLSNARQDVQAAEQKQTDQKLDPIAALNAQPVDLDKNKNGETNANSTASGSDAPPAGGAEGPAPAAPPVPPPLMPPPAS